MQGVMTAIFVGGIFLGFSSIIIMGLQKPSENQKILMITTICTVITFIGYYFEVTSQSIEAMLIAIKMGYLGKCYSMLLFLMFMINYCNIRIPKWVLLSIFVFNSIILSMILTCEYHTLYYTSISLVKDDILTKPVLGQGPFYKVYMAVMLLTMAWFTYISVVQFINTTGAERMRCLYLGLAGVTPSILLAFYLFGAFQGYDPISIGLLVSCLILTYTVLRYGLYDTTQLAKESIVEYSSEGMVVVDLNYRLLYANSVAQSILPESTTREGRERLKRIFKQSAAVIEKEDHHYEVRTSKLYEEGILRGYMAWILDMTYINNYTKEVIEQKDEAERANQEKSLFLANMSHEIRTPMNAVIGFAELALQKDLSEEVRRYIVDIKRSSKNLLSIINEILDISKIETGKIEIINEEYFIQSLLQDVMLVIAIQAEKKGLEFQIDIDGNLPYEMYGDNVRIREILVNILNNAIKYTEQGSVSLTVKILEQQGDSITIKFSIQDTGIGIKEEDKERLFDKFQQLEVKKNRRIEGTGLGLAISKAYIDLMGGRIEVESEYGKGSRFDVIVTQKIINKKRIEGFNFDLSEDTAEEEREYFSAPEAKIMIVDDNEINLRVARGLLEVYRIQTDSAESGAEAVKKAKKFHYDMILMDHMMPEMDGIEAMKEIRKLAEVNKDLPIIAVTANAISGIKEKMKKEGFDGYISKPIEISNLEKILLKFLPPDYIYKESGRVRKSSANTSDVIALSAKLPHIDVQEGLKNCGYDLSEYMEILSIAYHYAEERAEQLREFLVQKDFHNYTIKVHSLKSTAANIGAMQLSAMAKEHEMAGKEERYEFIEEQSEHLLEAYQKVRNEIGRILEERKEFGQEMPFTEEPLKALEEERLNEILLDAMKLLDHFELDKTAELLSVLEPYPMPEQLQLDISKMKKAIEDFDVDEARNLLKVHLI